MTDQPNLYLIWCRRHDRLEPFTARTFDEAIVTAAENRGESIEELHTGEIVNGAELDRYVNAYWAEFRRAMAGQPRPVDTTRYHIWVRHHNGTWHKDWPAYATNEIPDDFAGIPADRIQVLPVDQKPS